MTNFLLYCQGGLSENNTLKEQFSIPFLLHLCSTSVPLLDALMDTALPKGLFL